MIYLDNAATTKPSAAAIDAFVKASENFGNPSSLHRLGIESERLIRKARAQIAATLGVEAGTIYFNSGGTESDNTAIFGAVRANARWGRHVITTKIEHPAVIEPMKRLEEDGYEVDYIGVNSDGVISLDELAAKLREDTVLVSVMLVNNETGAIQPIDKIKALIREKSPHALLHTDAVQAYAKMPIDVKKWGVDLLSASGHKFHAVKGIGFLYAAKRIAPYILGGGQQDGFRSGTDATELICSIAAAAAEANPQEDMRRMTALRGELKERILAGTDRVRINGAEEISSGSILNVSFVGVRSEILLHYMEGDGIYVSSGSACSTHKHGKSKVLTAMGLTDAEIDGAVRFSLSRTTTAEEIARAAESAVKRADEIRHFTRR